MLDELLQDRAALYVSGAMTADEREQFELILEFHDELRAFTGGMADVAAAVVVSSLKRGAMRPAAGLKARILAKLDTVPRHAKAEGFVMSGPDGLVQWVNPAFTEMCGYTLDELRGKSLGPILQGEKTDRATSDRMRRAVKEHRPCRERILNYHKSGEPYWVDIAITPILDDAGQPLWMVAREREIAEPLAA
jgi:PAS domain S-box-containing protein